MDEPIRHPALEQSNTSILFGNKLFLKAYRRLHEGVNPELEMGRFLTESSPFDHIVPVAGGVQFERHDGSLMTLALLQGFVDNQGDAWHYTLDYLERFLSPTAGDSVPSTSEEIESHHAFYDTLVETLGRRVGEMHKALSRVTGEAAFDPEPADQTDLARWMQLVRAECDATLTKLSQRRRTLPETVLESVDRLLETREHLVRRIESIAPMEPAFTKTRFHGDLHLGQLLLVQNDFVITDFEGEPARPVSERRAKGCVLRDVAGMLRSFNYAAQSALRKLTAERPGDIELLAPLVAAWERGAREAFLAGYRGGVQGAPCYPATQDQAVALTEFFTIEKALYEVRYELDNRPAWIDIPVAGLITLAVPPDATHSVEE